jgi:putative transposase
MLEPRRRAEKALTAVIAQCYVEGVSTRRVDDIARAMGLDGISKSQVSRVCAELDELVAAWRDGPLDAGRYAFVWLDALIIKVREHGRVVNTAALVATGVNADGHREILGLDVGAAVDAAWTAFLRSLVARGLAGSSWCVPTPTRASRMRWRRCWTVPAGSGAVPIETVRK